jgi:hypothetical protein
MHLTRREFAAATAGGLSLFVFGPVLASTPARSISALGPVRHAHIELPAGPYTRAEVARIAARAAALMGRPAPETITLLGNADTPGSLPTNFAMTCTYTDGCKLVIRATTSHTGDAELTIQGQRNRLDLRYIGGDFRQS